MAGRLATEFGVNHATVTADGAYATAVDSIRENVGEDAAREIRSGRGNHAFVILREARPGAAF